MIFRVLLPFAFGYFLSYLYRVVNSVIAPDLVAELNLGPDDLGLLTASYFLTFAAFQIPLGVLLDRYGPRKIESGLLLFAAVGAAIFAIGDNGSHLMIGRALIGLGVSACLMAAFKAFTVFYPPQKLPLINGLIMMSGGLGAMAGTAPTEAAVQLIGWRGVFLGLAILTTVCAVTVYLLVPSSQRPDKQSTLSEQIDGVRRIFTNRFFWRVAPLAMVSQAAFISTHSLWVGPWHKDIAGLDRADVAARLFWIAASMIAGFLSLGALSTRLSRAGINPSVVVKSGLFLFMLAQIGIILQWEAAYRFLWLAFGFFGTTGILQYALLSQHFPNELAGRVNTALNLLVFISVFFLQYFSGKIIELFPVSDTGNYAGAAYQSAFSMLLLLQVTAFVWFLVPQRGLTEKK